MSKGKAPADAAAQAQEPMPTVDSLMAGRAALRPEFIQGMSADRLVDALLRMAMEISVLRERLDTYEAVLGEDNAALRTRLESFEPSAEMQAAQAEKRRLLVRRLLRDLG